MKRNFYIDKIDNIDELNKISITLNEMEEVSHIKIGKDNVSFTCVDPENIQSVILEINKDLILREIINSKKRIYAVSDEKKEMIFMFSNLESNVDAEEIQNILSKYSVYENVEVDFNNKLLKLTTNNKSVLTRLNQIIARVNPDITVEQWKKPFKSQDIFQERYLQRYVRLAGILIAVALGLVTQNDPSVLTNLAWLLALLIVGEKIIKLGLKEIKAKQFLGENILILLSCLFGWLYGAYIEAIIIAIIFQLSEYVATVLVGRTVLEIDDMINIPQLGRREINNQIEMISLDLFDIGDEIIVLPGEVIPLCGKVVDGTSQINTYANTSSDILEDVKKGDKVNSGSVNLGDTLKIKVESTFERSSLTKVLEIATLAPLNESRTHKLVEMISKYFTIGLVVLALISAMVTLTSGTVDNLKYLYLAAVLLSLSSAFAYKQASSFSVLAGVAKAFSKGVVIRENSGLDSLNLCRTIIYDRFDGVEVTAEEMELFEKLSKLYRELIIFNDGPVALENTQYNIYNDLTVEEKLEVMEKAKVLGPVAYIGDSFKDIALLQQSFVGISRGGLEDKKVVNNSDILLMDSNYDTVINAFMISKKQKVITYQNLLAGILCNAILALAALQFVLPWVIALICHLLITYVVLFNTRRILKTKTL